MFVVFFFFFFFSSRRRHTRSLCDWSSDVYSSDLDTRAALPRGPRARRTPSHTPCGRRGGGDRPSGACALPRVRRSEERRVGKSVDLGGRRIIKKKNRKKSSMRTSIRHEVDSSRSY